MDELVVGEISSSQNKALIISNQQAPYDKGNEFTDVLQNFRAGKGCSTHKDTVPNLTMHYSIWLLSPACDSQAVQRESD